MENLTKSKNMRAAIYIRCSSEDQMKGYGPQMQREDTYKAAVERDGCFVQEEHIIDDSKSGANDKRPGWQRLLQVARNKEIDVVYFWKLDRMMRDEYYFYVNEKELRDLGVGLRFATQNLDDPFNRAIQVAVAADERRKIHQRTYGGRIRALKDGKWIAQAPYGYFLDSNSRLKVNSKETKWIKQLFLWLVEDRLSLTALAKRAYIHRVPTQFDSRKRKKYKYGKNFWSKGSLGRTLSKDYYATGEAWFCKYKFADRKRFKSAELRPEADWIMVRVPPIISLDLFEKAQKQLKRNSEFARRKTKRQYLFAKQLHCKDCGDLLIAACRPDRENAKFYRNGVWSEKKCAECIYFRESVLDDAIWRAMQQFFNNPASFMARLERERNRRSKKGQIEDERAKLTKLEEKTYQEEKALLEHDLSGFYSSKVIADKRRDIADRRKEILERGQELEKLCLMEERRLQSIESAEKLYLKMREKLENPSYTIKQRIYGLLVDKILLNRQSAEVWMSVPRESSFSYFMSAIVGEYATVGEPVGVKTGGSILMRRKPYSQRRSSANIGFRVSV